MTIDCAALGIGAGPRLAAGPLFCDGAAQWPARDVKRQIVSVR